MASYGNSNSPPALDLSPSLFKSSCVGLETWQGKVYEPPISVSVKSKFLAKLGVSKLENAVAEIQEQFKDKEWKDRDGKENSFTAADLVFVQAKEASKGQARVGLGPKEKEEIGKLRGRHVMFITHEKCQPLKNLLCIYSFQNHIQFSQFCCFVTVASICLICITCF